MWFLFLLLQNISLAAYCEPNRYQIGQIEVLQTRECVTKVELSEGFGRPHRFYLFDSRGHFLIIDDTAKEQNMKALKFHSLVFLPINNLPSVSGNKLRLASGDQLIINTESGLIDWHSSFAQGLTRIQASENPFADKSGDILIVHDYSDTWLNYGALFGKPPESVSDHEVNVYSKKMTCETLAKNFFINGDFRYQLWTKETIAAACDNY